MTPDQDDPLVPAPDQSLGEELAPIQTAEPPERYFVPPTPGERITSFLTGNTYEVQEQIGEGNFGIAFRCRDTWGNELAAKVLKPKGTYERVRDSASAEFVRLLELRHPNITYVYDAFEFRDTFYIVTECCHSPVSELFNLSPFHGPLWLLPISRCLLQAVHYLHQNQYAHQDIHAGNVLSAFVRDELLPDQNAALSFKLGDLGVSKLFTEIDAMNTLNNSIRPPEAIDPDTFGSLDHRIDIYQTGLLLLQIALSRPLEFSQEEVLAGKPREMALGLPQPYNVALEKALRRHPEYRTASAMELWRDLNSGVAEAEAQLTLPGVGEGDTPPSKDKEQPQ